ncbi:chemotaxis protein CheW [Bacillus sp. FJAT-42376]|uniref:chemotaxis protein CheW n=1 Tax=Bacillus sp. FJAT-42376 TaxID=2014076 RepID=UPI000F4ECB79|nr:chemotaxis protein CheW [Bacillus sp. FJAT-42376]AZB43472.1 chemotaxis protein CheW [Bacillus sp. FJAT-42376]
MKAVIFQIQEEDFGIPIEHVVSIEKVLDLKPIPSLPDYVKGVMPIRKDLVPIIDLALLFSNKANSALDDSKVITIHSNEMNAGLLVNDAKEILELQESDLKPLPLGAAASADWFSSIAMKEGRLITVVDSASFIRTLEGIEQIRAEIIDLQKESTEKASI